MKSSHYLFISIIFVCATIGWWLLGGVLGNRTDIYGSRASSSVSHLWGPPLEQKHPLASYQDAKGKQSLLPQSSKVTADLSHKPRRRGLIWQRTYDIRFIASYVFENPTQITQTMTFHQPLPGDKVRLEGFKFELLMDGKPLPQTLSTAAQDGMKALVEVPPGKKVTLNTAYDSRGTDHWRYLFPDASRIQGFELQMLTNFEEVDFPGETGSPTAELKKTVNDKWSLMWRYDDVISARSIGMVMPKLLSPGPVAMKIALFAPMSLAIFFLILVITSAVNRAPLHPMHYLFIAAGFFAFPLLFAYMVDVVNIHLSFIVAAGASVSLVCGYLKMVAGGNLFKIALATQLFYSVLFSYSFFLNGLTGLTLTIGGMVTLGIIMALTAHVNWNEVLNPKAAARTASDQNDELPATA